MRKLILLVLLSPSVALSSTPYYPTLTGDQFVTAITRSGFPEGRDYLEREKAYSYLDGIRDGTEGHDWCDVNRLKTHDLAQKFASEIRRLPASERQRSASALLLEQLRRNYPCKRGGKA